MCSSDLHVLPFFADRQAQLVLGDQYQGVALFGIDQLHLIDSRRTEGIGKEGQNVRLAARLTGWRIDIKDTASYKEATSSNAPTADEA